MPTKARRKGAKTHPPRAADFSILQVAAYFNRKDGIHSMKMPTNEEIMRTAKDLAMDEARLAYEAYLIGKDGHSEQYGISAAFAAGVLYANYRCKLQMRGFTELLEGADEQKLKIIIQFVKALTTSPTRNG